MHLFILISSAVTFKGGRGGIAFFHGLANGRGAHAMVEEDIGEDLTKPESVASSGYSASVADHVLNETHEHGSLDDSQQVEPQLDSVGDEMVPFRAIDLIGVSDSFAPFRPPPQYDQHLPCDVPETEQHLFGPPEPVSEVNHGSDVHESVEIGSADSVELVELC